MNAAKIISILKANANPANLSGMQRFGIDISAALGIPIPVLRKLAKEIGTDHLLAGELWDTGIHEARILASMIDDPKLVTSRQMDKWTAEFNSWDICDQVCGNLFDRTPYAIAKAIEYSSSAKEFTKRAGFVLMAASAVHNKKAANEVFTAFFPLIEKEAHDGRNFVKKAVNWALRQIGKRNTSLNSLAIETARRIAQQNTKSAKWIARDALNEWEKRKPKP